MPLPRSPRLAAVILIAVCLPSCSGYDNSSPAAPDTTVVGIDVTGAATLVVGQEITYAAAARMASGGSRAVTGATWGTDAPAIVSIDNTGRVVALASGAATIWVDAEGRRGTLLITVRGRLVGNWILQSTNRPSNPSGVGIATKTFTENLWELNQNDPATGAVVFRHGGHYTLSGTDYVEYVDFAGPSTAYLIGQIFTFTITFDGDTHRQVGLCCSGGARGGGPNTLLDSVWRRAP